METLPKHSPAQVQAASCTAVLGYPLSHCGEQREFPCWVLGARLCSQSLTSSRCQPGERGLVWVALPAATEMLVWIRAVCTHSVLPLCSFSHGKELAKHTGILLIAFKAAFRKTTALEDGCVEIRPAGGSLVQWRCSLSCVRGVWHRARGMILQKRSFLVLSGLFGVQIPRAKIFLSVYLCRENDVGFAHWDSFIWAISSLINVIKGSEITGKFKWWRC